MDVPSAGQFPRNNDCSWIFCHRRSPVSLVRICCVSGAAQQQLHAGSLYWAILSPPSHRSNVSGVVRSSAQDSRPRVMLHAQKDRSIQVKISDR